MKNTILLFLTIILSFKTKAQVFNQINIAPLSLSSFPENFAVLQDKMLFTTRAGNDARLHTTDGTFFGTVAITILFPGENSFLTDIAVIDSLVFFTVENDSIGEEPFVTNGTSSGTKLLKNIVVGGSSRAREYTGYNGKIFFRANDGVNGEELWEYDLISEQTTLHKDLNPNGNSRPSNFFVFNNLLYFTAQSAPNGANELWRTDGSNSSTGKVIDITGGNGSFGIFEPIVFNNKIFFTGNPSSNDPELWVSDGTASGTQLLKDIYPGVANGSSPENFIVYNNKLYFSANDGIHGTELWVTDGSAQGTLLVKDIFVGNSPSFPQDFTISNGKLYFIANNFTNGTELWVTDGTAQGTMLVADIYSNDNSTNFSPFRPSLLTDYNNKLYFLSPTDTTENQLFVTDGSRSNTLLLRPDNADTNFDEHCSNTTQLAVFNNSLFFTAKYTNDGYELWKYTDTNIVTNNTQKDIMKTYKPQILIYPNPASKEIRLQTLAPQQEISNVKMLDVSGSIIYSQQWEKGYQTSTLQISTLQKGIYFIEATLKDGSVERLKLIKQ